MTEFEGYAQNERILTLLLKAIDIRCDDDFEGDGSINIGFHFYLVAQPLVANTEHEMTRLWNH